MRRLQHMMVSREGWYYLAVLAFVLAGAILRQINLLMLLYGLLAGPLLLSWWLVRATLKRLKVRRRLAAPVSAGEVLIVSLEVANGRSRLGSWAIVVEDRIARAGAMTEAPLAASALFSYVPAGTTRHANYRVRLVRRGRYRFGPMRVMTRFPLGLLRRWMTLDDPQELLIYPRLGRLTRQWQRLEQSPALGSGRVRRQQRTAVGDFYGLREWRADDSRRFIHWRTSARRQTLIVRQYEQQQHQDLALVLDLSQCRPEESESKAEDVELAVSFAATICADLCRSGGRAVRMAIAAAEPAVVQGAASTTLLPDLLAALAVAEACPVDRLPDVLDRTLRDVRPGTKVVLITTHSVDLSDDRRFGGVEAGVQGRQPLDSVLVIDVSRSDLNQYFLAQ
jgi:uncharacterized protein (DUF58 family)